MANEEKIIFERNGPLEDELKIYGHGSGYLHLYVDDGWSTIDVMLDREEIEEINKTLTEWLTSN